MISIASSTRSSSVPMMKVVLPAIRNPPVVASLVTENLFLVSSLDTLELSSFDTIANISFISHPPDSLHILDQRTPLCNFILP